MLRLTTCLTWFALLFVSPWFIAAVASASDVASEPWKDWKTSLQADHALAGRVWSARRKAFVAPGQLAETLAAADYVLIGEIHDNADHHRLQAWLIAALAKRRKPTVVMEMIGLEKADALDRYLAQDTADAAGLGPAVAWSKRGWPSWAIYQPIAEAALAARLTIRAGDVRRAKLKQVSREGLKAIEATRRQRLKLNEPLGTALAAALREELATSHCGMLPESALPAMSNVQRLRDAVLADSLIGAGKTDGAVLIAGNGHVRTDRAVPWYIARRLPKARVVSVMLVELDSQTKRPEDELLTGPDGAAAADFLWFTPGHDRGDPCERLRKRFAK
ncbi:MAG: ChaN family lipoprotein [Methyloligellaceae bacterium]